MKDKKIKKEASDIFGSFSADGTVKIDGRLAKWIGIVVAEVLVLFMVTLLFLLPRWEEVRLARKGLSEERDKLRQLASKSDVLDTFLVELGPDGGERILKAFPTVADVGQALQNYRYLANKSGVVLVGYRTDPVSVVTQDSSERTGSRGGNQATSTRSLSFLIDVNISGSYQGIQEFLTLLERSLPIKSVDDFQVVGGLRNIQDGGSVLDAQVTIRNYFLPLGVGVDVASALPALTADNKSLIEDAQTFDVQESLVVPDSGGGNVNTNLFGL